MVEDLTVLLVSDDEPDEKLIEQLEKKNLGVEISSKDEFESLLALVEPHIVVHTGLEGAEKVAQVLKATEEVRRVRLIIRAERTDLPELRKLDRTVVVSLLATDISPSVVAARVLMLAKKGPEKSIRPPSPGKSGIKAPAAPQVQPAPKPPKIDSPSLATDAVVTDRKPVVPQKPVTAQPPRVKKPEAPRAAKSLPPRAHSLKAEVPKVTPPQAKANNRTEIEEEPISLEEVPPSEAPPPSESPPSEFPTTAFEAPIPEAARSAANDTRIVLADGDVTRADIIACALRDQGIPTRIVPLDAAATHWPLVRDFSPTVLLGDGSLLKSSGAIWLQLFQADQALKKAKLVAVPFERLFQMDAGTVNLRTLIPHIPQLSGVDVSVDPKPTTGPLPQASSQPLPAAGQPAEAPTPFEENSWEDDENEFDRMTLARPIDEPLPEEALSSRGPTPLPSSSEGPEPILDSLRDIKLQTAQSPEQVTETATRTETIRTPTPTSASAKPQKSGGGWKLSLASIVVLALGAGGSWYILGKKRPRPAPQPEAATTPQPVPKPKASPQKTAETAAEIVTPPPVDPEIARWKVMPSTDVPTCESLIPNLKELSAGGVQQATLSLSKARQAMVRGELDDALKLMCEAVLVHPQSMALEELAGLYVTKKSPDQALKWQAQALEARPERPRTIELGGDIYNQLGRLDESRDAYVSSLKVDGNDQKTLNAVGKQYAEEANGALKAGSFSKAELLYRRAAVLNPADANATAGLAATSAAADDKEGARAWAKKTLSLDEGHHVALVVMAALATEAGDTAQAEELCNKALERKPTYPLAHQLLHQLKSK